MESNTFTVGGRRGGKKQEKKDLYLEGYGKAWGEKLTFTVGVSYFGAGTLGVLQGIYQSKFIAKETMTQKHLYRYNMWNTLGRTTTKYGNACASAGLMFCLLGKMVDLVFEEEIKDYGILARNIAVGGLTGAIYKSPLGARPAMLGAGLGCAIVFVLNKSINFLHTQGVIGFTMEL